MKRNINSEKGKILFSNPTEAKLFSLTRLLIEKKFLAQKLWTENFSNEIKKDEEIGNFDRYYQNWLAALEKTLLSKKTITEEEINKKIKEIESIKSNHHHSK